MTAENHVQSIQRASALLGVLATQADAPLGRLAEATGLHPATARRLLSTLESLGYVFQDVVSRRYRLGPLLMYLGTRAAQQSPLRQLARAEIERLVTLSGETVYTAVLQGNDVLYVDAVESHQSIRMSTTVGDRCPAYSTATGRVLLSYLPQEQLSAYLSQPFERQTPNTITDPAHLASVIQETRRQGFNISVDEQEDGVTSIAAPILADGETAVAAIAVAGPSFRLTSERVNALVPLVIESASTINAKFRPKIRAIPPANEEGGRV